MDVLENMDVTVLGTTGCGSPELANIHRDNSRIRSEISASFEPFSRTCLVKWHDSNKQYLIKGGGAGLFGLFCK